MTHDYPCISVYLLRTNGNVTLARLINYFLMQNFLLSRKKPANISIEVIIQFANNKYTVQFVRSMNGRKKCIKLISL